MAVVSSCCEKIADFERRNLAGRKIIGIADPAIFDNSRGAGGNVSEIFARWGVYFIPGDNRRLAGKMQLHTRLDFDESGRCGFYVFSTCRQFLRTVPALCYGAGDSEDVDTAAEDHIYDETRYVCMALPVAPRRAKKEENPYETQMKWQEE